MAGRKPIPTRLKKLAGNPGHRPLNDREPQPPATVPPCPGHLGRLARQEWERITPQLHSLGLLTSIDGDALAMYCQLYERWVRAERAVRRRGLIITTANGYPVQNPAITISNQAIRQMRQLLTEFGMTPSSRSRLAVAKDDAPQSLADMLFAGVDNDPGEDGPG